MRRVTFTNFDGLSVGHKIATLNFKPFAKFYVYSSIELG